MKKHSNFHTMTRSRASLPTFWISLGLALLAVVSVLSVPAAANEAGPGRHLVLAPNSLPALTDEALLDSLQRTAFEYFWNEANPVNGLIRDRSQAWSPCSIAAQGFGISAICIAIDHGWVSREEGLARIRLGLDTLWNGTQGPEQYNRNGYKGLFYHFLDFNSGVRTWDSELSTIDTALLMAGVLDAKQFFDGADTAEEELRALADSLYLRVDWEWTVARPPVISHGWKPESGFLNNDWRGYNEAMILYILALGSPTRTGPW